MTNGSSPAGCRAGAGHHVNVNDRGDPMPLSPELLSILVCPACKGDLVYEEGLRRLTCNACRLRYRIEDDIPVMLVEEAEKF